MNITLRTIFGNQERDKQIELKDGDVLVTKYPDTMPVAYVIKICERIEKAISENGTKVVPIPDSISINVISKG